jgi:hypothetical protein
MKKKFQLIGFAIIALLATSLFIGCVGEESKGKLKEREESKSLQSLPKDWRWYENKEWRFKLKYPAGWRKIEHNLTEKDMGADVLMLFSPGLEEGKGENFVEFKVRVVNFIWAKNYNLKHEIKLYEGIDLNNITLEEWVNVKLNDLQKMKRLIETTSNISLDSLPAKRIEYISEEKCTFYNVIIKENKKPRVYKINPSGEKIKGMIVCAIKEHKGYTLSLEGLVSGHTKYSDLAGQMISSFEFI